MDRKSEKGDSNREGVKKEERRVIEERRFTSTSGATVYDRGSQARVLAVTFSLEYVCNIFALLDRRSLCSAKR